MTDLNRAVKAGMAWLMLERGLVLGMTLLSGAILARLLTPADFGVLGMAVLFTGLSSRLVRLGFGMALIQRKTIRDDHVATLFVATLALNVAVVIVLQAIAPAVGRYFRNPLVGDVLALMSLNFVIRSIAICPSALLRRAMNFRALTIGSVVDALVKVIVTGTLAYQGYGVWSLVYGELAGGFVEKLTLVAASGWRPSLAVSRAAFNDLFRFGAHVSLGSMMDYASEKVDNFVVGSWIGATGLGLYEKAYSLMDLPAREISGRMKSVLFPVFARIHGEHGRQRAALRKTFLSLSLIGFPIFGSLIVLAPQIIEVLYGRPWLGVVLPFQILCAAGPLRMVGQVLGSVLTATGEMGPLTTRRILVLALLCVSTVVGVRWGIVGVATAVMLVNAIGLLPLLRILPRMTAATPRDVFLPQRRPLVATAAAMAAELACRHLLAPLDYPAFVVLVICVAAGIVPFVGVLYLLKDDALTALVLEFRRDLRPVTQHLVSAGRRHGRWLAWGTR